MGEPEAVLSKPWLVSLVDTSSDRDTSGGMAERGVVGDVGVVGKWVEPVED